jgi:hypothetical protein
MGNLLLDLIMGNKGGQAFLRVPGINMDMKLTHQPISNPSANVLLS